MNTATRTLLKKAEIDLRRADSNVELRQAEGKRIQEAIAVALDEQAAMRATCAWLRKLASEDSGEGELTLPDMSATLTQTEEHTPRLAGASFSGPPLEKTQASLCQWALERLGGPVTTKDVRLRLQQDGYHYEQDQVRNSLKYLAKKVKSGVYCPKPGIWQFKPDNSDSPNNPIRRQYANDAGPAHMY